MIAGSGTLDAATNEHRPRYPSRPQGSLLPFDFWIGVASAFLFASLTLYVAVVELVNIRRPMNGAVVAKSGLRALGCHLTIREASVDHRVHVAREACLHIDGGDRVTKTAWSSHLQTKSGAIPAFSIASAVGFSLGAALLLALGGFLASRGKALVRKRSVPHIGPR